MPDRDDHGLAPPVSRDQDIDRLHGLVQPCRLTGMWVDGHENARELNRVRRQTRPRSLQNRIHRPRP
jgi:hypothetical protein